MTDWFISSCIFSKMLKPNSKYLHLFDGPIESIELPAKFTFPFYYVPHPLVELAAKQLQLYIAEHPELIGKVSFDTNETADSIGKMFGILVVKNISGALGFLAAFSGRLADSYNIDGFVPPLYDNVDPKSFYKIGELEVSMMTENLKGMENNSEFLAVKELLLRMKNNKDIAVGQAKAQFRKDRKARRQLRKAATSSMTEEAFSELHALHKKESYHQQYKIKLLDQEWDDKISVVMGQMQEHDDVISELKQARKQLSNNLQHQLFDKYQFLNGNGKVSSLVDIFQSFTGQIPPSGAGDCAAPKLLQFAYEQNLQPLCMGEFWWGKETTAEVRKHGYFYPACRGKCEPILSHMLEGLAVDKNPMLDNMAKDKKITVLYEDALLAIISKPAEFLSVPGKSIDDSVYLRMKHLYPNATGPLIVHRLDMSTSGLMVIAKTKEAHKQLQKEFIRKRAKKRYTAILDGILPQKEGEVHLPIRVDLNNRPRQLVDYEYGKAAHTRYKVVAESNGKTLIHFYPITGRTHQLRMHAAHSSGLNTPILGDDLYGKPSERLFLHAAYLKIRHPESGDEREFIQEVDFETFLKES